MAFRGRARHANRARIEKTCSANLAPPPSRRRTFLGVCGARCGRSAGGRRNNPGFWCMENAIEFATARSCRSRDAVEARNRFKPGLMAGVAVARRASDRQACTVGIGLPARLLAADVSLPATRLSRWETGQAVATRHAAALSANPKLQFAPPIEGVGWRGEATS